MRDRLIGFLLAGSLLATGALAIGATVSGQLTVSLSLLHQSTNALSTAKETLPSSFINQTFATGSGSNQINQIWYGSRTIAASGVDNIDIAGGITDSFGTVVSMMHVRFIAISATATNSGDIAVGGPVSNGVTIYFGTTNDTVRIPPAGALLWFCATTSAWSNAVGSADVLQITNRSASIAGYNIYFGGSTQ